MARYHLIAFPIVAISLLAGCSNIKNEADVYQYSSKAIYPAPQNLTHYETAPSGYEVVYSELVERHGARALSSPKYDVLTKQIWMLAKKRGQLTSLGEELALPLIK